MSIPSADLSFKTLPFLSTNSGTIPGKAWVANVGFWSVTPARDEIKIPPVSVCHHVSAMGNLFFPIFSSYQCHASSFIGSPTDPKTFNEFKSY